MNWAGWFYFPPADCEMMVTNDEVACDEYSEGGVSTPNLNSLPTHSVKLHRLGYFRNGNISLSHPHLPQLTTSVRTMYAKILVREKRYHYNYRLLDGNNRHRRQLRVVYKPNPACLFNMRLRCLEGNNSLLWIQKSVDFVLFMANRNWSNLSERYRLYSPEDKDAWFEKTTL